MSASNARQRTIADSAAARARHVDARTRRTVAAIAPAVRRKYADSFSSEIDQRNSDGMNSSSDNAPIAGARPKPRRASRNSTAAPATNSTPFSARTAYGDGPNVSCSHDRNDMYRVFAYESNTTM